MALHMSSTGISFAEDADEHSGMTAELLDDYEEGAWTAAPNAGSITGGDGGHYTKIGRLTSVQVYFHSPTTSTGTTAVNISGLPHTVVNNSVGGARAYLPDMNTGIYNFSSVAITNGYIFFTLSMDAAAWITMTWGHFHADSHCHFTCQYPSAE